MLNPLLYQFRETLKTHGKDIKINNIDTRVILKSTRNEYDDKEVLTTGDIGRGDYINYNDLYFITLTETADQYGSVYNKSTIRRTNFDIKFIIDDRLFQFPTIIESKNAYLADNNLLPMLVHTLQITIPLTPITEQIKIEDAILKWGQKWKVTARDYTKDGLIILTMERIGSSHNDDKENEIADRYVEVDGQPQDKLKGNINPILPFDVIATEIVSVQSFNNVEVEFGTPIEDIELPQVATVTLDDATQVELNINWNTSTYYKETAGIYTFYGTLELIEGVANTGNHKAQIKIAVDEEIEEGAIYIVEVTKQYQGDTEYQLSSNNWQKYHIKKLVAGEEVEGSFTFALGEGLGGLTLTKESNNICKLSTVTIYGKYNIDLIITDTDIDEVVLTQNIYINGR